MSPLGWHPPHLMNNSNTQYLGDQHWQQCWFFVFLFFLSICLSRCKSLCSLSVHLFTINLKFSTTHNYWLAQLVYMSLVSGLELKNCKLRIKMLRNSSKKSKWETIVLGFGSKQRLQQQSTPACFIGPVCLCVWWFREMFVFCLSSLLSVFLPDCEQLHWKYMLDFSEFLHVARDVLNQSDSRFLKIQCPWNKLYQICT